MASFSDTSFSTSGFATTAFDFGTGPVPDPVVVQTPAGSSKHKRRFYVEIDGQNFPVASPNEAIELLQRARALAEHQAESKAVRAEKVLKRRAKIPKVEIKSPEITTSPEIAVEAAPLIADIERLYKKAAEMAELRLLLAKKLADEDDEDDVLLLL